MYGTPPPSVCTNDQDVTFSGVDPRDGITFGRVRECRSPLRAPATDADLLRAIVERLERYDMRAVLTGPLDQVTKWRRRRRTASSPAIPFDDYERREPKELRRLFAEGRFAVFAEIGPSTTG
jgi:hypothetical protein